MKPNGTGTTSYFSWILVSKIFIIFLETNPDICKLELINPINLCHYNLTRYYFDFKTSSCKEFLYSGCFGNANNFETMQECERKCQIPLLFGNIWHFSLFFLFLLWNSINFFIFLKEQCSLIPEKGPCHGNHQRWYYDSKLEQCTSFSYGGCFKNKNNYETQEKCIDSCVKPRQKGLLISQTFFEKLF